MEQLPIYEIIPQVKEFLQNNNTVILQAPPGAGKSTVLPLELLDEPWMKGQRMLMLQPRRIAARSVALRMADLYKQPIGQTIGYRVRFETCVSKATRIEVLTEGILSRMMQNDMQLEGVGMVLFDEFHERSLHADLALALCREVQSVLRPDLRIVLMSATLQGSELSARLGDAPVLSCSGRQYPIEYRYVGDDDKTPLSRRVAAAVSSALNNETGNILAFLPGGGEIQQALALLTEAFPDVQILPLYGDLSPRQQQEALQPTAHRKVVLATSIAETSLTIAGIRIVVDSGVSRIPRFDVRTGMTRLETVRVSLDSANQRAGRAGRLEAGLCFRLWSAATQHLLEPARKPEIEDADLAPLQLELAQWGSRHDSLQWITPPPSSAIRQADELLTRLGAIQQQQITETGRKILSLSTHPRIARMLHEAAIRKLLPLATDLAAVLEERDPLARSEGANLALRIDALRNHRAKRAQFGDRSQLARIENLATWWRQQCSSACDNTHPDELQVGLLTAFAYPDRIARRTDEVHERFKLSNGQSARIENHDALSAHEYIVVANIDAAHGEGRIHLAAPIPIAQFSHLLIERPVVRWDKQKRALISRVDYCIDKLVVRSQNSNTIPRNEAVEMWLDTIRREGLRFLPLPEDFDQWQARILSLRCWTDASHWPDVSDQALLDTLEQWLAPLLENARRYDDLESLPYLPALSTLLSWDLQQELDRMAPARIQVPSDSYIKLQYQPDGSAPVLAVRLQEMFGMIDTPAVAKGAAKVLVHLLSPGYKPVQVTQDLRSFWQNGYKEVKKELRARYPRHSWPDDPFTAQAIRGAVKRRNV